MNRPVVENWVHPSGRAVVIGGAAHPTMVRIICTLPMHSVSLIARVHSLAPLRCRAQRWAWRTPQRWGNCYPECKQPALFPLTPKPKTSRLGPGATKSRCFSMATQAYGNPAHSTSMLWRANSRLSLRAQSWTQTHHTRRSQRIFIRSTSIRSAFSGASSQARSCGTPSVGCGRTMRRRSLKTGGLSGDCRRSAQKGQHPRCSTFRLRRSASSARLSLDRERLADPRGLVSSLLEMILRILSIFSAF